MDTLGRITGREAKGNRMGEAQGQRDEKYSDNGEQRDNRKTDMGSIGKNGGGEHWDDEEKKH